MSSYERAKFEALVKAQSAAEAMGNSSLGSASDNSETTMYYQAFQPGKGTITRMTIVSGNFDMTYWDAPTTSQMEQRWKGWKTGANAEEFRQTQAYLDLNSPDWVVGGIPITDEARAMHIQTIEHHIEGQTVFGDWNAFLPEGTVTE